MADPFEDLCKRAEVFHAHLDACPQCRNNPFNLCMKGVALINGPDSSAEAEKVLRGVEFELMNLADQWQKTFDSAPFGFLVFDLAHEKAREASLLKSSAAAAAAQAGGQKVLYAIGPAEAVATFFLEQGGSASEWKSAEETLRKMGETATLVINNQVHLVGATIVKYHFSKGGNA